MRILRVDPKLGIRLYESLAGSGIQPVLGRAQDFGEGHAH